MSQLKILLKECLGFRDQEQMEWVRFSFRIKHMMSSFSTATHPTEMEKEIHLGPKR